MKANSELKKNRTKIQMVRFSDDRHRICID